MSGESAVKRRRGRPASNRDEPLGLSEIVDRALEIVHAEGLDAISMRRLAADLGVTTGALYHHLPDKSALLGSMLDRVWERILVLLPPPGGDPIETLVEVCATTRRVWLYYFDLASLAVAVAEPDELFFETTRTSAAMFEAMGFPDVPLAYNAVQNFTMGSIEVAANRRAASAVFGRDPKRVRAAARRMVTRRHGSENHLGVVDGRFDEGDALHFEAALRALLMGLMAQRRADL